MVTQEWSADEGNVITLLGFTLNFKGYYVKDNVTLTKRLDSEFNEMYYQAFGDNGLLLNIPISHVENPFQSYIESVEDLITTDIINFDKLLKWIETNLQITVIQDDENQRYIIKEGTAESFLELNVDIEKILLYNVLNKLIKNYNYK